MPKFKTSFQYKINVVICLCVLLINKGYFVLEKDVLKDRTHDFRYTKHNTCPLTLIAIG